MHDARLPENLDGLLLYGGYPELNGSVLEKNEAMRREIRDRILDGMPCMAECGGFMYLHEEMEGMDGEFYRMAGVIPGRAYRTPRLSRFGYVTLRQRKKVFGTDDLGGIPAHEFHYFDSENCGETFSAVKPESRPFLELHPRYRHHACRISPSVIITGIRKYRRLFSGSAPFEETRPDIHKNNKGRKLLLYHIVALAAGFLLDLLFGDPRWLYHPVCLIGNLIAALEKIIRKVFPKSEKGELAGGFLEVLLVCALCLGIPGVVMYILYRVLPPAGFILETFWCYQLLAAKSLKQESMRVYDRLKNGTIEEARHAVSMIVGRDTNALTEEGVTKAAVETVAENSSDGVIAPMIYMALGGVPLMFLYKGINTMDSMLGYKNDRYLYFGRCGGEAGRCGELYPRQDFRLADGGRGVPFRPGREERMENIQKGPERTTQAPTPRRRSRPARGLWACSLRETHIISGNCTKNLRSEIREGLLSRRISPGPTD